MEQQKDWFVINSIAEIDSPALMIYRDRVKENIRLLKSRVPDTSSLRPHVKTNKIAEVCQLMMDAGIRKFKCATIAEAEMLGMIKAPDVLLAYQPVGPKVNRLIQLIKTYRSTIFSSLVDNETVAGLLNQQCKENNIHLNIFIDLNVGMNRTGILPGRAVELFRHCSTLSHINPIGFHAYDGHILDSYIADRQQKSDNAFKQVEEIANQVKNEVNIQPVIVVGGSPSFPTHANRKQVECSPGTFVFWDWGYKNRFPDEPYQYAALVVTRVIAIIDQHTICADLGHKSVAAENPLPRVHFFNAPGAIPIGQSEEHLVLKVANAADYAVGDVLYGVPVHICPTVALYEKATVIENNERIGEWEVIARKRKITI